MRREVGNGGTQGIGRRNSQERDEDLVLFREMMHKQHVHLTLLQQFSDEFETHGTNALYRVASGKRGPESESEFLTETGKNDYDWLKTPPATPLFPSLEMEANSSAAAATAVVVHREIPVMHSLSRFAGNSKTLRASTQRPKSPNLNPKLPVRHQMNTSFPEKKNMKTAPVMNLKMQPSSTQGTQKSSASIIGKPNNRKVSHSNYPTANLSRSTGAIDSSTKSTGRGISPLVRSRISAQIPGISFETPTNLKTERSVSASRWRSGDRTAQAQVPGISSETPTYLKTERSISASRWRSGDRTTPAQVPGISSETPTNLETDKSVSASLGVGQKQESSSIKARRQSCSPSVMRGRKLETAQGNTDAMQMGRFQQMNRTQIMGSKMVDKFLNARMSSTDQKQIKTSWMAG